MSTSVSTRQEILDTALQLFTVQGYDATSLRQIADRLGFTKAALYYHFPAKDHLVIELTRPWLDAISNLITLDEQQAGDDISARRARLLSDYVDIVLAHQAVLRFLGQDLGAMKHPDVGKRARNLVLALQDALAGPDAGDEDRLRVACALGAVHAAANVEPAVIAKSRGVLVSLASQALGLQI